MLSRETAWFRHEDVYACSHLATIDAPCQVKSVDEFDKAFGQNWEEAVLKAMPLQRSRR
jgi:hypothetical protein